MKKFLKKNKSIIILCLIILISSVWLLSKGLPYAHDISFHYGRLIGLSNSIKNGDYLALIHDFYYGFGYANGIFYCNFYLYIPAILNLLGVPGIISFKILYLLINIFTTLSIYFVLKSITKDKNISLIGTVLYMFANYRLVDIYARCAIGEMLAFMVIPLVILGIYEITYRDYKKWYIFSIGIALLAFAHLISTFLVAVFIFVFIICNYKNFLNEKTRIKYLIISLIVGLLLSICYILPIIEQKLYAHINIFEGINSYFPKDNTVSLSELLIPDDFFNKFLGYSFILLLPLRFFIKAKKVKDKNVLKCADILFVLGIVSWLFTTNIFQFFWTSFNDSLNFIQFPWRLLIVSTTFLTFAYIIYLKNLDNEKIKKFIYIVIIITSFSEVILYDIEYGLSKVHYSSITDNIIGNAEYLPYNTDDEILYYNMKPTSNNNQLKIKYEKHGTSMKIFYENNNRDDTYIQIPLFNYLGYSSDNGIIKNGDSNLIRVLITDKEGTINISYTMTSIQKISYIISSLTLVGLIVYLLLEKRKKKWI